MKNRSRQKAIIFMSAIAIIAILTVAIANVPNKSALSVWQYNLAKSYQHVIDFFGSQEELKQAGDKSEKLTRFRKGDRYGYLNEQNQVVIPAVFDTTDSFLSSYAKVKFQGKYGIIDRQGKAKTGFIYDSKDFIANSELGYIFATRNNLQRIVDIEGNTIIPAQSQYDSIDRLNTEDGYAIAVKNDLEGAVDLEGKILLPIEYESIYHGYSSEFLIARKNKKRDLYSVTKGEVTLTGLDDLSSRQGNYRIATKNGKQGLVEDTQGTINIPVKYDLVAPFSLKSDSIIFKNDERDNETAIMPTFENGKRGVQDVDNNRLTIPPEYDRIDYINSQDNYGIVVKDGQTGFTIPEAIASRL